MQKRQKIVKKTILNTALLTGLSLVVFSNTAAAATGTASPELNEWLQSTINVLSAMVMAAFVISMIIAGIQYMTARDDASQVSAAKDRIVTIVITFPLFIFGYAILQWLVPGGIF